MHPPQVSHNNIINNGRRSLCIRNSNSLSTQCEYIFLTQILQNNPRIPIWPTVYWICLIKTLSNTIYFLHDSWIVNTIAQFKTVQIANNFQRDTDTKRRPRRRLKPINNCGLTIFSHILTRPAQKAVQIALSYKYKSALQTARYAPCCQCYSSETVKISAWRTELIEITKREQIVFNFILALHF